MLKKTLINFAAKRRIDKLSPVKFNYWEASSIGIIINGNEQIPNQLDEFINDFQREGKATHLVSIVLNKNKTIDGSLIPILALDDFNLFGQAKSEQAIAFTNRVYDVVILIDNSGDYLVKNLASLCKSNFFIGFNEYKEHNLLAMVVKPSEGNELSDLMKYLKMAGKNE